jgi:alkylhydroperoxidase family enzyme
MDINAAVGGERGLSREKIDVALGIRPPDEVVTARERLALEYADRVSATPVDVPDAFFADLVKAFSEREIVELTATIAHENYNSKFNRPLRVEANNFCAIPLPTPEEVAARRTK